MSRHGFVEDGRQRAVKGIWEDARQAVEAEYADQLKQAGWLRRACLRLRMCREIRRRVKSEIEDKAPRDGRYFRSTGWMWALLLVIAGSRVVMAAEDSAPTAKPADYRHAICRLEQTVKAELQRGIIAGVAVALVDDQRIVLAEGFGLADKRRGLAATGETVYRAGSISKLFTAIAAMQLVEQRKLDPDRPVAGYDPQFAVVVPFGDAGPITLRQLMCHRSGLVRESPVGGYLDPRQPTIAATVASLAPCVLVHRPGTHTKYSNVGPTITGRVVGLVAGMPFVEYQEKHVLGPLGMRNSSFLMSDPLRKRYAPGNMRVADGRGGFGEIEAPLFALGTIPAGNLYTTAEDLARFVTFLLAEGRAGDKQILQPETLKEMFSVQFSGEESGFGLGFHVGKFADCRMVSHMGAVYGHTASIRALPDEKIGTVVLTNEDIAMGPVRKLADAAMELMIEAKLGKPPKPREKPIHLQPDELAKLAGDYQSESYWARIEPGDDGLTANVSGQRLRLTPVAADKLLADGRFAHRAEFELRRDQSGKVTGFSALEQTFARVNPEAIPQIPDAWKRLLGSYGPEFIPLIVSLRHGRLYAMTENMVDYRLTPLNRTVFAMPAGMYVDEHLVFQAGPDGKVHSAVLANMVLRRTNP